MGVPVIKMRVRLGNLFRALYNLVDGSASIGIVLHCVKTVRESARAKRAAR